ncbi:hypothetical protein SERLADRAFT_474410 [Serpula lacrymans var. lacrymans S7.9]|uniref:Uncharacterized protein n=1 Tax=Serpula lacrymans var. lacrymans (strain S7.9) TaxID=578457 RepID=F8P500_SERL9|nr:uncharacterized protein SERLADRAFT_474410 [Serpula lacrymans var. lacrymans S7.9]EGO21687.1 hypothetical protein SERLADRAFT_474410 [Serpula lacrymans var. lacrymans S7.9]
MSMCPSQYSTGGNWLPPGHFAYSSITRWVMPVLNMPIIFCALHHPQPSGLRTIQGEIGQAMLSESP